MIGQVVSHYRILEKLGEGGMGVVYKAHDTKLDRIVALKFLPHNLTPNDDDKARFLQEAKAASALNHPNVCTIYDIKEEAGEQFIVMEFVEGKTLREIVPLSKTQTALDYAIQIAEGLQEAHNRGIVHRDIKTDNIMVNEKNQIKILDFGLAKLRGSLKITKTSSTIGTVAYMAPEQIQGEEVDARSDIFSFGVVLFEMLTGHLPFKGEHEAGVIYSILNTEPEPLLHYVPDPPSELQHMLDRALEKNPDERYQSVGEMVIELRRMKRQSTRVMRISSPPELSPTPQQRSGKSFLSKYKWRVGAGGVGLLADAALTLLLLPGHSHELNPAMTTRMLEILLTDIRYPGLSGDGNWTAFPARDASGNWHVYFMNTGNGESRAITTDSMNSIPTADVSPDGSRVVYDGAIPGNYRFDIYVTSALGGGTRMIAQNGDAPKWQPDGKRVFFLRGVGWVPSSSRKMEIWSVTPEGTEERLEFIDNISVLGRNSLSVSPNGKAVVWLRTFSEGYYQEVLVRDLVSGAERQLTFNKKNCDEVCWASNNQIIFSSNKSGNTNLWMVPAEGGPQVQITKGLGPDCGMKISTDLKKLLYYERQEIDDLWIGSLASGTTRQITFDDKWKEAPGLSPDGKFISYVMYSADPLNPQNAIYVSNCDGSNRRQLASSAGMKLWEPLWSPDGSRILYYVENPSLPTDSSGRVKTYVIDAVRTGAPKFIAEGWPFMWLNADSLLLSNGGKTWLASITTGQVNQFFEDSTAYPVPGGKFVVYYDSHESTKGTWIIEVDGSFKRKGAARRLDDRKDGYTLRANSPSRDFLIFRKPGGKLLKMWLASGKEEPIPGTFSNVDNAEDISLNPGTNEFIYNVGRTKGRLVMIENLFK